MVRYIPIIPTLRFPKTKNLFHTFCQADVTTFSIYSLPSIRLVNDPPFIDVGLPIILLAIVLSTAGRSAGNIIWSRRFAISSSVYIPLVASDSGLTYFHVGLVIGFIMIGGRDSMGLMLMGLEVNLYQASPKRYIAGVRELLVTCVPWRNNTWVCGVRKYVWFVTRVTGSWS